MNEAGEDEFVTEEVPLDSFVSEEDAAHEGIAPTYEWRPDGTVCEACGATVEFRWRDDDQLVCGSCKSWHQ